MKLTETQLASTVQRHMVADGWDCFAEVQMYQGDKRADLVAVLGTRVAVVETKLSLSFEVLSQALRWLGTAHHVIVAVPEPKNIMGRRLEFIEDYLETKGIGLWWVSGADQTVLDGYDTSRIREMVRPALHRYAHEASKQLRAVLVPEMRETLGGAKVGGIASTPFKRTCLELQRYVAGHPGISFGDAIRAIRHHYSSETSAKGSAELLAKKAGLVLEHGRFWPSDFDRSSIVPDTASVERTQPTQPALF